MVPIFFTVVIKVNSIITHDSVSTIILNVVDNVDATALLMIIAVKPYRHRIFGRVGMNYVRF